MSNKTFEDQLKNALNLLKDSIENLDEPSKEKSKEILDRALVLQQDSNDKLEHSMQQYLENLKEAHLDDCIQKQSNKSNNKD